MATARPASPTTTEPSDNECSVCNELFTVPKLLPCGHVLCRHCLVTWLQSQPQAQCPLCRCPVVEPVKAAIASNNWDEMGYLGTDVTVGEQAVKSNLSDDVAYNFQGRIAVVDPCEAAEPSYNWDAVADVFPTDLAMVELVEAERLLNKDHQCCFCDDAKATFLCLDCHDLYCASCKNGHIKQKMSRHHSVQDLISMTADQLSSRRPSPCPAHADKACELYCPSHDTSMCTVCFASRHRSCPDVTDLQQKADASREVLQQLATKLADAGMMLDQGLTELDQHLQDKEKKSKASLVELKAACNRLKSSIDAYYIRVEQEVEEDRCDVSKKVNDDKACLSQRRGRVTSESGIVERVQGIKKHDAIITMTSVMEKRINDLDFCGTFSNSFNVIEHKTLLVDEGTEEQIPQQLLNLGTFSTERIEPGTFATEMTNRTERIIPDQEGASTCDGWASLPIPEVQAQFAKEGQTWCFHSNHGQNIVLSNGSMTAERRGQDAHGGIVLGNSPMAFNYLYEVRVEIRHLQIRGNMSIGAVTQHPTQGFTQIPRTNFDNVYWRDAVVIRPESVLYYGRQKSSKVGSKLNNLPQNSTLGVSLDRNRVLHLYVDGQDQGVAARDMKNPCWPMFELYGQYRKITALPVTVVSSNPNRRFTFKPGFNNVLSFDQL